MSSRRPLASILVLVIVGLIGVFSLTERPRFQGYHTVDVVQLVASGMCFGVALARLLASRRRD